MRGRSAGTRTRPDEARLSEEDPSAAQREARRGVVVALVMLLLLATWRLLTHWSGT